MSKMQDHHRDGLSVRLKDGRRLGFAEYGDPEGKPLLYFHGGVSSRLDIAFAAEYCKKNNIRIIAPDRPGTGLSSLMPPGDFSLDSWANDMEFLLDHLNLQDVRLLGWSLGGPYVFVCVYKLAERISKAATIGAAGPLDDSDAVNSLGLLFDRLVLTLPEEKMWMISMSLKLCSKLPPFLLKQVMLADLSSAADKEIVRRMSDTKATQFLYESLKQGSQGVIDDYRASAKQWSFPAHEIRTELHLWQGGDDKLCPMSMAQSLHKMLPSSTLNVVPGQGHFLLHNHLDEVLSELMR